jgi:P27 family predicted phage terminase small subunit
MTLPNDRRTAPAPNISNSERLKMVTKKLPKNAKPPASLGRFGRKFWVETLGTYEILDAHHLQLLENASLCLDRAASARDAIKAEGVTVKNRFGEVVAHPAANIERQSMTVFRQNLRELGLDIEAPSEVRGPRRPGSRQ